RTVAKFRHQAFGRMRKRLEARQADESAGALDGVHNAENIGEDLRVIGFLLEADEFDVDQVEALVRLYQEFLKQLVHAAAFAREAKAVWPHRSGVRSVSSSRLISVERVMRIRFR